MKAKFSEIPKVESDLLSAVIVRSSRLGGYWGRGATVAAAIKASTWIQSQDVVYVCQCDGDAYCDEVSGDMHTVVRGPIYKGKVMADKRDILVTEEFRPARLAPAND